MTTSSSNTPVRIYLDAISRIGGAVDHSRSIVEELVCYDLERGAYDQHPVAKELVRNLLKCSSKFSSTGMRFDRHISALETYFRAAVNLREELIKPPFVLPQTKLYEMTEPVRRALNAMLGVVGSQTYTQAPHCLPPTKMSISWAPRPPDNTWAQTMKHWFRLPCNGGSK